MCDNILNKVFCNTNLIGKDIEKIYKYIDLQDNLLKEQIIIDEEIDVNDISNVTITQFDNFFIDENNETINLNLSGLPKNYTTFFDISFNADPNILNLTINLPTITNDLIGSKITIIIGSKINIPPNPIIEINSQNFQFLSFGSSQPESQYVINEYKVYRLYATENNGIFLWILKI